MGTGLSIITSKSDWPDTQILFLKLPAGFWGVIAGGFKRTPKYQASCLLLKKA